MGQIEGGESLGDKPRKRPMNLRVLAGLSAILPLSFPALAVPPPRYFPLDPGNKWMYVAEGWPGWAAIVRVLSVEGDFVRVDLNGTQLRLAGPPDELDLELPGEGLVPYYRFSEESWFHRDLFECDDGVMVVAASRDEVVETPAGLFKGCLRLDYKNGNCDDAGRVSEWWKPEVGLVKWIDQGIEGWRVWVLESFERERPPFTFLRGDGDGDGEVVISDAVFALEWLFRGGPVPACEDTVDSNDDGKMDLSDPIYLLGFLFLGLPPPPHPGPPSTGFDGTPTDPFTCGDPPAPECSSSSSSTLPGVSFALSGVPCVLTIPQVARGFSFVYEIVVEDDLPGVTSFRLDDGSCDQPDESGLVALERIRGGSGRVYCICDSGRCGRHSHQADLEAGTWETRFEWDGRNWRGPSDTMNPKGAPFPPGTYIFSVEASGQYLAPGGVEERFEIYAQTSFHLVP